MRSPEATFVFADIAGFTALTEVHGDETAAAVAQRFCARVRERVAALDGAELVKTVGDAVMLRVERAADAVALGIAIVCDLMGDHGAPVVRVGMHSGPALARDGDWFGASVNVAARVAGEAAGGEVLVSERTRALAGELEQVVFEPRGLTQLRNVREPVWLYAASRVGEPHARMVVDPVCRMALDPRRAAGTLQHRGAVFHFCSLACAGAFASDPERYLRDG
jgi:adenylate cyclase